MTSGTLHPLRARSLLLQLLGQELIGDGRPAILELDKNGYDADANEVEITVSLAALAQKSIVVQDARIGMALDDSTGKCLELPGFPAHRLKIPPQDPLTS